jgi:hypothetical protein
MQLVLLDCAPPLLRPDAERGNLQCWSFMSEVDRVFPPRTEGTDVTQTGEKRFIQATSRKRGLAPAQTRIVEVVHLRSTRSKPAEEPRRRAVARQHAETWPDGFRAKTAAPQIAFDVALSVPEPAPPTIHVVEGWNPLPTPAVAVSPTPLANTVTAEVQLPPATRLKARKAVSRRFADPFARDDTGANCLHCGYLVERVREDRGKMTCSQCG